MNYALYALNRYLLQWFTLRLCQRFDYTGNKKIGWGLYWGIVPNTGWDNAYSLYWWCDYKTLTGPTSNVDSADRVEQAKHAE